LTASDVVSQTTARDASNATTPNPRLDTSSGIEVSSPREECFGELSEDGIADDNAQKATDYNAQVTLVTTTTQAQTGSAFAGLPCRRRWRMLPSLALDKE
jgi:hypothetical protein